MGPRIAALSELAQRWRKTTSWRKRSPALAPCVAPVTGVVGGAGWSVCSACCFASMSACTSQPARTGAGQLDPYGGGPAKG